VCCGLCGIDSLEQASRALPAVPDAGLRLSQADVAGATEALRACQPLHDQTRATHAAGFLIPGQGIVLAREDVGRHNALDKLIGALVQAGIDPGTGAFVMTSRLSVELVQKCAMAGCPMLIAVSAPTAHAVRLAEAAGITLAAFARAGGFDLFSHPFRIIPEVPDVA
jgi:FdhD protein